MAIKVLVVGDGPFPDLGMNFAPSQDLTDDTFTVSEFVWLLENSQTASISVDTAHRRNDPSATFPNFNFATSVDLLQYDVLWLFGYEGWNGEYYGTAVADAEVIAIANFMNAGRGVFATGDHNGLGSYMCGMIPRVASMRKWFGQLTDIPPGYPISSLNYSGATVPAVNWPGGSSATIGRADTLQINPAGGDTPAQFQFDDQSDEFPQPLSFPGPVHSILQGPTGTIKRFPDHMHEGEVVTPLNPNLVLTIGGQSFTEYPAIDGFQPLPGVIATGSIVPGHATKVEGSNCEQDNFVTDTTLTVANTIGTLCVYDGRAAGVGRVVTDSSFHHYLDLNLIGDPCGSSPDRMQGFGAGYAAPASSSVLADIQAFYVNTVTWLASNRNFYFVVDKSTFGTDEVSDSLLYPSAFWLFLEGFTPNLLASSRPNLSGAFESIPGITISLSSTTFDVGNSGANKNVPQRIRFGYDIQFTSGPMGSLSTFPAPGAAAKFLPLTATIAIQGQTLSLVPQADFELVGGDDPYFTNVNATAGNYFYLSQDLRVFTGTPAANKTPVSGPGAPSLTDSFSGAYDYIQQLITWLNQQIGYLNPLYTPPDTNISDPLDTLLPDQSGALDGDSSVTPKSGSHNNYNFAIARVRLKGSSGLSAAASNVKVFFRVFTTQTFDTDFIDSTSAVTTADPNVTYLSSPSGTNPQSPLPGTDGSGNVNGCSLPFFANANFNAAPTDYGAGGANNQTIKIPATHDYAWAFYGCFLNVNDATNVFGSPAQPVQHWLAGSAHNCLVAQIAYDDAPIINENGLIETPENSDKLAQRNLQVTTSGNPGFPATHRVPQTIDVRPSPPAQSSDPSSILSYPDEMMIDWGKTPLGAEATIYWPGVSAGAVVQLASRLYSEPTTLTAPDANTIQCRVVSSVTYIPIPSGPGGSFAGLLTVSLPSSVRYGNEFDILVRRMTTKQVKGKAQLSNPVLQGTARVAEAVNENPPIWRYITGSFLVRIPVQEEANILPVDENLLAILKWRLALVGPGNRWYPILLRYIGYLSARINGMGGNASSIEASANGYQRPTHKPGHEICHHQHGYTGKVTGLIYDRFGDFEGFFLLTEDGHEHVFHSTEAEIESLVRFAWIDRVVISALVREGQPECPVSIILRRAPRHREW
jgi:hypothetical protein